MTETEKLIQALKAKQPRRVMVYMEVMENGKWVWELSSHEVPEPVKHAVSKPLPMPPPARSNFDRPKAQTPRPTKPPFTMGRDPALFLFTFGKFKGQTIDQVGDVYELNSWVEWANKQEEPTTSLEVAKEMVEAYLIEREFVPSPKTRRA